MGETLHDLCNKDFLIQLINENEPERVGVKERYAWMYLTISKYLSDKIAGWNIGESFEQLGIKNFALYAMSDIAQFVVKDLQNYTGDINFILADRNPNNFKSKSCNGIVHDIEYLLKQYRENHVEKIVVCSLFYANEIFDEFMNAGIPLKDILTVCDVIWEPRRI